MRATLEQLKAMTGQELLEHWRSSRFPFDMMATCDRGRASTSGGGAAGKRMKAQPELCENCERRPSVVGLNGLWVCLECFTCGLTTAKQRAESLAKLVSGAMAQKAGER
jgi:ribosomal protein L37AE/L43A